MRFYEILKDVVRREQASTHRYTVPRAFVRDGVLKLRIAEKKAKLTFLDHLRVEAAGSIAALSVATGCHAAPQRSQIFSDVHNSVLLHLFTEDRVDALRQLAGGVTMLPIGTARFDMTQRSAPTLDGIWIMSTLPVGSSGVSPAISP